MGEVDGWWSSQVIAADQAGVRQAVIAASRNLFVLNVIDEDEIVLSRDRWRWMLGPIGAAVFTVAFVIDRDREVLSQGPPPDPQVVTAGTARLSGSEFVVGE